MNILILYEDEDLLVIHKPPGVIVNRAESVKVDSLQDWIDERYHFSGDDVFVARSGTVHRIDKETSGCLVIAKNAESFVELQRQFKERIVKKSYLAIVHGIVSPKEGEIRAPVGRLPWNRERFGILPGGKEAVTKYKSIKNQELSIKGKKEYLTLVELYPETGRTHQIRVHLKYINHPILGDWQYAGRKTARDDREWAKRVMLHAKNIEFMHPRTRQPVAIEAPVPDDMNNIIK